MNKNVKHKKKKIRIESIPSKYNYTWNATTGQDLTGAALTSAFTLTGYEDVTILDLVYKLNEIIERLNNS